MALSSKRILVTRAGCFNDPLNPRHPHEIIIRRLAQLVGDLSGSKSKLVVDSLPGGHRTQRRPDTALATAAIGWKARVALRERLAQAIDYFRTII
jgi:UDP-glucuronate decarboxylase